MASQNTVTRTELTEKDKEILSFCSDIVKIILEKIPGEELKKDFLNKYGKIHESRDAGQGRAAGKLQRDALTTRGRQAKAPFSNRNFRWHPLVVSTSCGINFKPIDEIFLDDDKTLGFKIQSSVYKPKDVYKLEKAYCITAEKWKPIVEKLKELNRDDWIKNWCTIPASEYSTPKDSIETFAILGLSIACNFYKVDLNSLYNDLKNLIGNRYNNETSFPNCSDDLLNCPLCKSAINQYPGGLNVRVRPGIWNPPWQKSKRREGEDESLQLTHVEPLQEGKICHTAKLTRYGHRWCNVAMTDHSIDDVVDFMYMICKNHKRI